MRTPFVVLLCVLAPAAAPAAPLTFDDIVARRLADPERLEREAERAGLEREIAATGRNTREGPTLELDAGPRRMESGAVLGNYTARVEVPFLSDRAARDRATETYGGTHEVFVAAEAVASRLRLRVAYLDAWLAQAQLDSIEAQELATLRLLALARVRAKEGAEASYEPSIVDGEALRLANQADEARAASAEAWSSLRALADLPAAPQPLEFPGLPALEIDSGVARDRFGSGVLARAAAQKAGLQSAAADLDRAVRSSRWAMAAAAGREGDETYATLGAAYRFPSKGEAAAIDRERSARAAAAERAANVESARLQTSLETTIGRLERFGAIAPPTSFSAALDAVGLRLELGKERPSQALPVRRQILEAQAAALQRIHDAHALRAALDALTAGDAP